MTAQLVIITRPSHKAEGLAEKLGWHGIKSLILPAIEIKVKAPDEPISRSVAAFSQGKYGWVIFSSANAVEAWKTLSQEAAAMPWPASAKAAVIGEETAQALLDAFGKRADLVPADFVAEGLLKAFEAVPLEGKAIVYLRSGRGRKVIETELKHRGALIDSIVVYETKELPFSETHVAELKKYEPTQLIFPFFSPSAFKACLAALGKDLLSKARIVSIGPVTAAAIQSTGLQSEIVAKPHTEGGILAAIGSLAAK